MGLDIVRGNSDNIVALSQLVQQIVNIGRKNNLTGSLYIGYPLSASAESKVTIDALLVTKQYGLVAFILFNGNNVDNLDGAKDDQDTLYYQISSSLNKYQTLRKGRELAVKPIVITFIPDGYTKFQTDVDYLFATSSTIESNLSQLSGLTDEFYVNLCEALQKVSSIKPRKRRESVKSERSMGYTIKQIEKEIANLDQWQKRAALEVPEGPQRIRGLAGSGKTIVLALKAAYLHTQHPDWEIIVTYYTRALWQQYHDLIYKFTLEFSGDQPDWEKLHLCHAWGSFTEDGVYSLTATSLNIVPMNFGNAKSKYGMDKAFSGICTELLEIFPDNYHAVYDAVLIDEAQDMPASFFKIIYKICNDPKRIIWAYDELQNLSTTNMPSLDEMFGLNPDGSIKISLSNDPSGAQQDIVLPVCYRNTPWALVAAHSLGFGLYRKEGLVQFFEDFNLWNDIGYQLEKGELDFGRKVVLSRRSDSSPEYFSKLIKPEDAVTSKVFESRFEQYEWVATQIERNIEVDELDPDDILVVFPNPISAKEDYRIFCNFLIKKNIQSILTGVTDDRDIFRIQNHITCSGIYRAKGNEAPMVYVLNSEYCSEGYETRKLRNILFTSITRSRAWVYICGTGEYMKRIDEEISMCKKQDYKLSFKIPTRAQLERIRLIHKDKTEDEKKKLQQASKGLEILLDLASKGQLDDVTLAKMESLVTFVNKKRIMGIDEDEE